MPAAVPLELREPKDVCKISLVFDVIGCNDSVAEFLIDDFALVVKREEAIDFSEAGPCRAPKKEDGCSIPIEPRRR